MTKMRNLVITLLISKQKDSRELGIKENTRTKEQLLGNHQIHLPHRYPAMVALGKANVMPSSRRNLEVSAQFAVPL